MRTSRNNHRSEYRERAQRPRWAHACRIAVILAVLFPVAGCTNAPEWFPELLRADRGQVDPAEVDTFNSNIPRETVRNTQANLAKLGYDPGPADGIAGERTREAVIAYQKDSGDRPDGRITEELAASLSGAVRAKPDRRPAVEEEKPDKPELENADIPPLYEAGDHYIWDDGKVETVVRVSGDKLFWRDSEGKRFTADRNFLIPASSWAGPAGTGEATAVIPQEGTWPLRADPAFVFDVKRGGIMESWQCHAAESQSSTVPAGTFPTIALVCERAPAPSAGWHRRIWYYAPEIRHYVARTDVMADGSTISRKLVGVRPGAENWPPAVRAGLIRATQDALENLAAGESTWWSSTVVKEEFEIKTGPIRTLGDQNRCRTFELIAHSADSQRKFPAIACASQDGEWQIPSDERPNLGGLSKLDNAG